MLPKLIRDTPQPQQHIFDIFQRPVRLAFIVNRNVPWDQIREITLFNCQIWGGYYNLFVPTDGQQIREDWWRTLYLHDPDVLIFVGDVEEPLAQDLYIKLQPFQLVRWAAEFIQGFSEDRHRTACLPMRSALTYMHRTLKTSDKPLSGLCIPTFSHSKYIRCLEFISGYYPEQNRNSDNLIDTHLLVERFGATTVSYEPSTFSEYLETVDELRQSATPSSLTAILLKLTQAMFFSLLELPDVIITDGSIDDLFFYFAAQGNQLSGKRPLLVLQEDLTNDENIALLVRWVLPKLRGNVFRVDSLSVSLDQLVKLRSKIKALLPPQHKIAIDFGVCVDMAAPFAFFNKKRTLITIANRRFVFELPETSLQSYMRTMSRLVVEIEPESRHRPSDGFLPSMFPDLNFMLSRVPDRTWFQMWGGNRRMARGQLAQYIRAEDQVIDIDLPTAEELITKLVENAGFNLTLHENKGRYCEGFAQLVGGIHNLRFLRQASIQRLLLDDPALRKGHSLSYRNILKRAKPGNTETRGAFDTLFQDLLDKKVFLRGFEFKCPACDLTNMYELDEIRERVRCEGCQSVFQLPLEPNYAYRLNRLLVKDEGAITVLLTALFLNDISSRSMMWQGSYQIRKGEQPPTDLDIVAMCDGVLVVGECKHSFSDTPEGLEDLFQQLQTAIDVAREIQAGIFIFSTLKDPIPSEITTFFQEAEKREQSLIIRLIGNQTLREGYKSDTNDDADYGNLLQDSLMKSLPTLHEKCVDLDPEIDQRHFAF